ncbi:hypothetical protein K1X13_11365 [Nocardioides sp. WL0053]|uniref:AbiEi antitoxin C-terminal domain-containing protein n=1 Tax=Nocardioides jiangsuensis TaxID=2866161 RepID=A0ABS7RK44_9ACTN|nr:hypothetical protein [Nocardioides jiangsuensis]MBY9075419.1 hypothetical protein [Nocardioides jiangsuensis]
MAVATSPEPEPTTALDLRRPFTRADAVRAGISPRVLRTSRFRRIFRGVYVLREQPGLPRRLAEDWRPFFPGRP